MLLILYTVFFYCALPIIFLRLLWRSRHNPAYRQGWSERLGFVPRCTEKPSIWVHAVSVGEVIASTPMIQALVQQYPDHQVIVTTTTPTGRQHAKKSLGDRVRCYYLPYDVPSFIHRFIRRTRTCCTIVMETEIWPNLFHCHARRDLPLLLANSRLSPYSMKGYQRIRFIIKPCLNCLHTLIAQDQSDADRYLALGLQPEKLIVGGNIKFDLHVADDIHAQATALRDDVGFGSRLTIILASTHEGEEAIWVPIYKAIQHQIPGVLLVVVPRHPQRFDSVNQLLVQHGWTVARRSQRDLVTDQTDVYLADTLGEMMCLYAASDVAFVGGSLVPIGGHNLIEPAVLGVPSVTGSILHNFSYVKQLLLDAKAIAIVDQPMEIASTMVRLLKDSEERYAMGQRGKEAVIKNQGALQRHLDVIQQAIRQSQA